LIFLKKIKIIIKKINTLKEKYKIFFTKLWKVIYKTTRTFNLHGGVETAGYLSFSLLFAIFPFAIFFTYVISLFGKAQTGLYLLKTIKNTFPPNITETVFPVIDSIINTPIGGILSLATISLLWSSSSMVQTIKGALNKAYRIRKIPIYFKDRVFSILQFLVMVIFILIMIFLTVILPKTLSLINNLIPIGFDLSNILIVLEPFFLIIFLFIFTEFLYYIMPSKRKMKLKKIFWGSILTVSGWVLSGSILSFYLREMAQYNRVYGSFAGIIVTLFFFFIMSLIFIFGAEFNRNLMDIFNK
jgi:membrane protein